MTKIPSQRIRGIYGILSGVSIAVAGVCLIWACLGIYSTGDQPFSREVVAAAFSSIAIPVYLCLILVIGGFILDLILPEDTRKRTIGKNHALILERLHAKTDLAACDESIRSGVLAQQKSRKLHRLVTAVLLTIGSLIFLIYAFQAEAFHQSQINDSMIRAMKVLLPCMALPCCYGIFTAYHRRASMEKEIALLKQADAKKTSAEAPAEVRKINPAMVRNVIALIAVALMIFGFCTGGTADVLTKAVNICTECVGLG